MKQKYITLGACCLLASGLTVCAGPLQRADLPAEPAWVVHVDFDGLRPTTIGQFILGEMEKPEAQAKLEVFQSLFSFDLRTQLHGLTLYGTGNSTEDGVLLVYADFNTDKLLTLAKASKDYQSTNHNQHAIHNWVDGRRAKDDSRPRTYAANQGSRVVIFGQRESAVAAALDVLDHVNPSLTGSKWFPQMGAAGDGSFIQAAAGKMNLPGSDPHAAVFKLAKAMRFQMGETQKKVSATLTLDAQDEDVAEHMASVGQGLLSLLKLQKEKAEVMKLADALSLKQDGSAVVATLTLPAADLVGIMNSDAVKKARKSEKD
jgi:hypothetical protein